MRALRFMIYISIISIFLLTACTANNVDELSRFKLITSTEGNGTITVTPLKSSYLKGDKVDVTAHAAEGWEFVKWEGKTDSTENPVSLVLENDKLPVIAVFSDKNAQFTLKIEYVGKGSVTLNPEQATYLKGTQVTLTPVGEEGWVFMNWDEDLTGAENPATVTLNSNKVIQAIFLKQGEAGIQFADPNLEKAVRLIIGKPNGPITQEDVEVVRNIDLSTLKLLSLDGLEYLTELNILNLSETGSADIHQMATLHNMERLYLKGNLLTDISVVSNMLELVELDLNDNSIEDISSLIWLWNKNLQVLRLGDNDILDISILCNLTSLEELELQNNRILDIESVMELQALRELNLAGNLITDFSPISGYQSTIDSLEVLNLSNNQIDDIDNLVWLWANGNLRELYLAGNNIIEIRAIHGLTKLEKLDLSNNDIIDLAVFKGMDGIRELKLNGNRIEDISNLVDLIYLEKLHLHDNQIIDITPLLQLGNLKEVSIMNNPPLDITDPTIWDVIQQLQARGVTVFYSDTEEVN